MALELASRPPSWGNWNSLVTTMGNCLCVWDSVTVDGRRFAVKENIGEGGFSTVDLVQDRANRRYYVLKRVLCHGKEDEINAMKEVQYHARFNSVNCVNIIKMECYSFKKHPAASKSSISSNIFIILPYYRRGTLQSELDHRKTSKSFLGEKRVLRLFRGICEAVGVFHSPPPQINSSETGQEIDFDAAFPPAIAHRDIKPANILLSDNDTPILMDFGSCDLAKVNVSDSKTAMALQDCAAERCTMPYRAPELFNVSTSSLIDERTDIWSLGCLLFALSFLEGPFDNAYQRGDSIALAANAGKITFPDSPHYSTGITDLIKRLMRVDPNERPFITEIIAIVDNLQRDAEDAI